jgi:transcriptional regulator with GAF, ATPase, and Fis domain
VDKVSWNLNALLFFSKCQFRLSTCRQNSGNIRELQNLIKRAVILSNHGVLSNPLPAAGTQTAAIPPAPTTLRDSERAVILQTLDAAGWAVGGPNGAAAKLGLKRTTLIYKMQKLAIFRPGLQSSLDLTGSAPQEQRRSRNRSKDRSPENGSMQRHSFC